MPRSAIGVDLAERGRQRSVRDSSLHHRLVIVRG
jgi:hypothetical protein